MNRKSLSYNAVLNCIKTIASIIFPLITLPYINRVLLVENIGKLNFSISFISYFIQIAGLGIASYAIREGSKLRDNKSKLNDFCNQVFTINIVATLVSFILLILVMGFFPGLNRYALLVFIQSINILGTTIGISWLYAIVEDYVYVTIRTLVFQLISLVAMFIFVKSPEDIYIYAIILVISTSGSSFMNYMHSKKYITIRISKKVEWRKHLPPIFTLFATSIAMVIYVNSDTTMISLMVGDYYNGIYSVAVKIYFILKNILASIMVVTLPRLSYFISNKMYKEYNNILKKSFSIILILILPIIVGVNILCREVVLIVAGKEYMRAATSLQILSIAILFSLVATYFSNSILLPIRKEKIVLKATMISALVNIILNIAFINSWKEQGAALTTLIAEILVVVLEWPYVKKYVNINLKTVLKSVVGCIYILIFCFLLKLFNLDMILYTIIAVIGSSIGYFIILVLFKTEEIIEILENRLKTKNI